MDFTVVIRTYNRAKYIPDLLQQLKAQIEVDQLNWEIIIIDNNSTDNTAEIVKSYQDNWDKSYPLKYFLETKQGGFYARKRAIKEAKANLIGFLDDDNLPALNWVKQAYLFAQEHPQAGAFGSKIIGEFEGEIPENIEEIAAFFPIITWPETFCFNTSKHKGLLPPGAGLVINKKAWLENVPEFLTLQGPVGDKLDRKNRASLLRVGAQCLLLYNIG
jgi:glycosyltransferase involved in cell wall biosynthesis